MASKEELYDDGMAEFAMGEFDGAVAKFKEALAADVKYFDAWHALSETYFRKGDYDAAIEAGKKSLELNPGDQLAHTSLSRFYVKKGMIKEAEYHAAQSRIGSWKEQLSKPKPTDKPTDKPLDKA